MKNFKYINLRFILLLSLIGMFSSCEREFSDDVEFATFPPNGEVFLDAFSAGLDYFPFVDAGADPEAFSVDSDEAFSGEASMRFDVPAFGNGFVGANFGTTVKRDLSRFDALTFYARASQAATINEIGFGISGETGNKFQVAAIGLPVSTRWEKYVIPIPDATNLIGETGLFYLAEGASFEGDEGGYTLWFDEVQFETTGTIAQPRPAMFFGQDIVEQTFVGSSFSITGLTQTVNLNNGVNQVVSVAPSYFTFESTENGVASVSERGEVTVVGTGTTNITAILAGVRADGSLEVNSSGALEAAPTPPVRPEENVRSIFSDAYTSATNVNFTPNFGGSTTEATIANLSGNSIVTYSNNNFTGIVFENTVDASSLTLLHVDVYVQQAGTEFEIQIRDAGANQVIETDVNTGLPIGDDADRRFTVTGLTVGQWTSFDIPLDGGIAAQKNNLGSLILVGGPNFILDNIYFYTE